MAQLEQPLPFGNYQLLRRIGAGGMGEVFLARRHGAAPGEVLVIKKILPHLSEDAGFVGRFLDEGKVVVHLDHENIARVVEMGDVDGQFFMAMEYVEGKTLAKVESRLREMNYSFPVELGLWVGAQVCDGLAHAHSQTGDDGKPLQVVHRDISPSNVMITYDGAVKIIDFGAALSTLKEEMTAPRVVIGNLSYMAPEHAKKQHVDLRADLFSVGVVLWELITWQLIPADGDPIERWKRAARPSFQKPSSYRPDLPPELDGMLLRALQPDARERYPDAQAFRAELLELLGKRWPATDGKKLGNFMRSLFLAERDAERAIVAEAMGFTGPVTAPITDPFSRQVQADSGQRSDPMPVPLGGLDTTTPGSPALMTAQDIPALSTVPGMPMIGRDLSDPAARATTPGRPPLDVEALSVSALSSAAMEGEPTATGTLPPTLPPSRPIGASSDRSVSTRSDTPQVRARPMQRTPTRMRTPLPAYVWAALGVGLGFFLVGLVFALLH